MEIKKNLRAVICRDVFTIVDTRPDESKDEPSWMVEMDMIARRITEIKRFEHEIMRKTINFNTSTPLIYGIWVVL